MGWSTASSPSNRAAIAQAEREGAEGDRGDLLWMLLSSRDEVLDEAGQPTGTFVTMTDAQVRDEVLTIFLAGYETVANGLTWTWYLLSQHPEVGGETARGTRCGAGHGRCATAAEA